MEGENSKRGSQTIVRTKNIGHYYKSTTVEMVDAQTLDRGQSTAKAGNRLNSSNGKGEKKISTETMDGNSDQ